MTEIKDTNGIGQIKISDDVIAMIAGTATLEVKGVSSVNGDLSSKFSLNIGRKNLSKGIKIFVEDINVTININLIIMFGYKIKELSTMVQDKVKNAVENMTGLNVDNVNIFITGIDYDKSSNKETTNDLL